jgi:hypothetical protein
MKFRFYKDDNLRGTPITIVGPFENKRINFENFGNTLRSIKIEDISHSVRFSGHWREIQSNNDGFTRTISVGT